MTGLVVATTNQGKLREIREALAGLPVTLHELDEFPRAPEVVEDGDTFAQNAAKKAIAIGLHTGLIALADDSGIVVDALGGAPGVHSARYAGEDATDADNNRKLLATLAEVPPEKRTARFVCVIVVAFPDGRTLEARGECEGVVLTEERGEHGFGYDPLFFSPELGKTFGKAQGEEKLSVSHRGRALRALTEVIRHGLETA